MEVTFARVAWAALLALMLLAAALRTANAQDGGQAGLVIVTGSGDATTYCVDLAPEEVVTGDEFLQRVGVKIVAEQNAMGSTICSLNGTGCAFPAESCFCQCAGNPCTYWSYWRQDEAGVWQYATAGATNTRIKAGIVEGWVWGEGTTKSAKSPPAVSLGEICKAPESADVAAAGVVTSAAAASAPAATPAAAASAPAATPAAAAGEPAVTPAAAASAPAAAQGGSNAWSLAGLAALVVIPVVALLLLRGRKDKA